MGRSERAGGREDLGRRSQSWERRGRGEEKVKSEEEKVCSVRMQEPTPKINGAETLLGEPQEHRQECLCHKR